MWEVRLNTARGQASLALSGVLVIVCASAYSAFLAMQSYDHDRAVIALAQRQGDLVAALATAETGQAQQALLAVADTNLLALAALADDELDDRAALRGELAGLQRAWATHRPELGADGGHSRTEARSAALQAAIGSFRIAYEQQLQRDTHEGAIRQVLILASAAPLLAWALLAITSSVAPPAHEPATDASPGSTRTGVVAALFGPGGESGYGSGAVTQGAGAYAERVARSGHSGDPRRAAGRSAGLALDGQRAGGMAGELRLYAADFQQLVGIMVRLNLDERAAESVPASAQPQLLTIAREAMSSAQRHGQAGRVSVDLWSDQGSVWLAIADDGARLDPQGRRNERELGLSILRARAERIGGELRVSSRGNAETVITIRLPVLGRGSEHGEATGAPTVGAPRRAW